MQDQRQFSGYGRLLEIYHPLNPTWRRRMRTLKVKIMHSKTSYTNLQEEVNKFLETIDYSDIEYIKWHDTPDVASVMIGYLADKEKEENVVSKTTENRTVTTLTAKTQYDLCQMIAAQLENKYLTFTIRTYMQDGLHHAEFSRR